MKTTKTGIFTKIISCLLCTAITLQVGLALTVERVNAASYETSGLLFWFSNKITKYVDDGTLIGSEEYFCDASADNSILISGNMEVDSHAIGTLGAFTTVNDGGQHKLLVNVEDSIKILAITMNNSEDEIIQWDGTLNSETVLNNGKHSVLQTDSVFSCSGTYTNNGTLENDGTFTCGTLTGSGTIKNGSGTTNNYEGATINAGTITVNSGSTNSGTINVTSSLTFSGYSSSSDELGGIFVCNDSTMVSSDGATFTIKVGNIEKKITGVVNTTADRLVYKDPEPFIGDIPDVYYGQDLDSIFIDYVSVNEGYDKTKVYFEYADSMQNELEDKPDYPNDGYNPTYNVRAVAPADGTYYEVITDWVPFKIEYLPLISEAGEYEEDGVEGLYPEGTTSFVTISGANKYEDEYYVSEGITLTPPEGILISCPTYGYDPEDEEDVNKSIPSSSLYLTIDDLFNNGDISYGINQDSEIAFTRASDNATTSGKSILDIVPEINPESDNCNYIFDDSDPDFEAYIIHDEEDWEETSVDNEDAEITANELLIYVTDDNLSSVLVNVAGRETDLSNTIEEGYCEITLNGVDAYDQEVKITAKDKSGRESQAQFTLKGEPEYVVINETSTGITLTLDSFDRDDTEGSLIFTIKKVGSSYVISYEDPDSEDEIEIPIDIDKIDNIRLYNYVALILSLEKDDVIEADLKMDKLETTLAISESTTFKCKALSGNGRISNSGTLVFVDYDSANYSTDSRAIQIINDGTIVADNIDISTTEVVIDGETFTTVGQYENSIYEADSSFTAGEKEIYGKVVANYNTIINSAGGTFTLQVGNVSKIITGEIANKSAGQLLSDGENYGSIFVDGNNVVLQTIGDENSDLTIFNISKVSGGYKIECLNPNIDGSGATQTVSKIDKLTVKGHRNCVYIHDDLETEIELLENDITIYILENAKVTCTKLTVDLITSSELDDIDFHVDGELVMTNLILSNCSYDLTLWNSGTIFVDTLDASNFYIINDSEIVVTSSFTNGFLDIGGKIIAGSSNTKIKSAGGEFTLCLGEVSDTFEGEIDSTAGELFANNANVDHLGSIFVDDENHVTLYSSGNGTVTYYISKVSNGYQIECDRPNGDLGSTKIVSKISKLTVGGGCSVYIEDDLETKFELNCSHNCIRIVIEDDDIVTCIDLKASIIDSSSFINIEVNGILYMTDLIYSDYPDRLYFYPTENSAIYANNMDLTGRDNSYFINAEKHVEKSFIKGEGFGGKVIAGNSNTKIKSAGGSFTLELDGKTKEISGEVDDTAAHLMLDPATVTLTNMPTDVYYGQNLSNVFSGNNVSVEQSDYDGAPYFEYSTDDGETYTSTVPASGTFLVRSVAPGTEKYAKGVSEAKEYTFTFLPASAISTTGNYYTLSGMKNGKYITDSVTINAPEGFQISTDSSNFSDSITITDEGILNGDINELNKLHIYFKRSDGAYSDAISYSSATGVSPNFTDLVRDTADPVIRNAKADGEAVTITDGSVIIADTLTFNVYDFNLDKVYLNDVSYTASNESVSFTIDTSTLTVTKMTVYAIDLAGRELEISFRLSPRPVEPERATVTLEDVYYGEDYDPVVDTDSDGDVTFYYRRAGKGSATETTEKPTEPGDYTVIARIAATDNYLATSCSDSFTIMKAIPDVEIIIPDEIYAGEDYEIIVETNSDGEVTKRFYNDDNGFTNTVYLEEPDKTGDFIVTVRINSTNYYEEAEKTEHFTVKPKRFEASVTVDDIVIGETPAPVIKDVPDDFDGSVKYEYKRSDETEFSAAIPSKAGTYTIKVTFYDSHYYSDSTCSAEFNVLKNAVTAIVSVADIFVGETPNPVVTTVSDGKVTIEYKTADTEFTTTIPTAAGEYTVRATVAESDTYLETTCSSTFTINKNEVTKASVSVADIFVGETPNPVVTTDSDGKAVFEYKISTAPDTSYTSDVPTAAGTYTIRATIPETDAYLSTTCTANFDILKNEVKASLAVADIKVGGTVKPVITINPGDYDGVVSYQYKISTAEDSTYTSAVPTAAGTYMVKATLPATDKYLGTTCTTNFDIVKNEVTASVSVDDILVGGTVKPVVTTDPEDYDGVITFEYKGSTDAAFSKTVPTAAGTYTVRATLPETAKFFGTTCNDTFTISKNAVTATVSVADIFVGETPKPVVTTDPKGYDGVITFEYKESSEADTAYTSAVPTAAGRYTVRATLSSTANFLGTSCEDSFSIVRKEVTASVSVANIYVGQTPSPVVITESDGKDKATFEYKLSSDPDTAFTTTAPTKLGTYTCKATIPETDNYLAITCSCEFVINLNPVGVLELSVPDTYYGLTVSSSYNTDSDGEVSIVYKTAGAPDTTYASVAPTKVGDYTAMITVSETETYESASTTTNFKISYLEAPATAFVPKGTEGNNGYFTSDVDLTAPAGYTISTTLGSGYSGSVAYTESLGSIFLKRDDGALTAAIGISDRPKIDKVAPVISSASGVMYVDSMSISVSDKNLMSLTVNGSPVAVSGGSASVTLKRPEKGSKTFTIVAEDEAGNITTIELTLMEEWLSDRKVPEGQAVSLVAGEIYYFNEGEWIVSIVNSDGTVTECSTVFSCNLPFYVGTSGDYIFTRVT